MLLGIIKISSTKEETYWISFLHYLNEYFIIKKDKIIVTYIKNIELKSLKFI